MSKLDFGNGFWMKSSAKLNLYLELLGKRSDGFHDLDMIMVKTTIADHLHFSKREDDRINLYVRTLSPKLSAEDIPTDESNLITKTIRLLSDISHKKLGLDVLLCKRIPSQAGLGGASSNAATALLAANRIWKLKLDFQELWGIAARIGSDVAFFLGDSLARCTGRGEKVHNLNTPCRLNIVVAKPQAGLSTGDIYRQSKIPSKPMTADEMSAAMNSGRAEKIGRLLFNRLQGPAAKCHPDIVRLSQEFTNTNCLGHQMTGSGSCYFGIYRNRRLMLSEARRLANRLPDMHVMTGQTLNSRNYCLAR